MVKAYSADANMRDNSGKKPRQYMKSGEQFTKKIAKRC